MTARLPSPNGPSVDSNWANSLIRTLQNFINSLPASYQKSGDLVYIPDYSTTSQPTNVIMNGVGVTALAMFDRPAYWSKASTCWLYIDTNTTVT